MNYLKEGLGTSSEEHRAKQMRQSLVPKSERVRLPGDIKPLALQTTPGLCGKPRPGKGGCWRKAGHEGACP